MELNTQVFPDLDALSHTALEDLMRILRDAAARRGRFAVALSGGRTPTKMFALWVEQYRTKTP